MSNPVQASHPRAPRHRGLDREFLRRFGEETHGGVMAYVGVMLPGMLGITGPALDGSLWYAQKRDVQAMADTAAYSVMLEMQRIGDTELAKAAAKQDAVLYGLDESAGDSITFHIPPAYGAYAGMDGYYEVVVERPAAIFLSGIFVDDFDTAARAASGGSAGSPPPCLMASDPSMKSAFKVNNGSVKTSGCDIPVNSSDDAAVDVAKNGILDADPINIVGDYVNKGTMEPGTYIISGGSGATLSVAGQATVSGSGATTYFDGESSLSINGQGAIDLASPTSGTYAGVLFYGDPNADPDTEHKVTGNGSAIFDGNMYFPTAVAKVNGNGNTTANTSISAVMARQLRFGGNGTLNFHIAEDAVLPPALQSRMTLVE